jgi:hypothetical protein
MTQQCTALSWKPNLGSKAHSPVVNGDPTQYVTLAGNSLAGESMEHGSPWRTLRLGFRYGQSGCFSVKDQLHRQCNVSSTPLLCVPWQLPPLLPHRADRPG